jgi:methyl coenzyme M reductase subunit C-like uncharacterized protein (methanogenesis marker protein 7)
MSKFKLAFEMRAESLIRTPIEHMYKAISRATGLGRPHLPHTAMQMNCDLVTCYAQFAAQEKGVGTASGFWGRELLC